MKLSTSLAALILSALSLISVGAHAADAACDAAATEKKLAGAAKNSFLKKCEKDAAAKVSTSACDTAATEKKLAGAAKNSFLKKCAKDAAAAK